MAAKPGRRKRRRYTAAGRVWRERPATRLWPARVGGKWPSVARPGGREEAPGAGPCVWPRRCGPAGVAPPVWPSGCGFPAVAPQVRPSGCGSPSLGRRLWPPGVAFLLWPRRRGPPGVAPPAPPRGPARGEVWPGPLGYARQVSLISFPGRRSGRAVKLEYVVFQFKTQNSICPFVKRRLLNSVSAARFNLLRAMSLP